MHEKLLQIQVQLGAVITALESRIPNDTPFSTAHNNWSFPGLSKSELIEDAQSLIDLINEYETESLGEAEARLTGYIQSLSLLTSSAIPSMWGNPSQAVPAYKLTIDGLRKALSSVLIKGDPVEAEKNLRKLTAKVRGMESNINALETRSGCLASMIGTIEQAHSAADQLPTDLASLDEARQKIAALVADATKDQDGISSILHKLEALQGGMAQTEEEAKAVLEKCKTSYSAATSVGLAAAFNDRSIALSRSMWIWVVGLIAALITGGIFGSAQLHTLSEILKIQNVSTPVIALNFLLSVLSVGAPVWFAWLSTKQIGQRFRLAEDYAFKTAVSRAYEGFRLETARFDKEMEAKLLTSALARLDEQPLRFVETASHGSPWQDFASSDIVKQAMRTIPEFGNGVERLAIRMLNPTKSADKSPASLGKEAKD